MEILKFKVKTFFYLKNIKNNISILNLYVSEIPGVWG